MNCRQYAQGADAVELVFLQSEVVRTVQPKGHRVHLQTQTEDAGRQVLQTHAHQRGHIALGVGLPCRRLAAPAITYAYARANAPLLAKHTAQCKARAEIVEPQGELLVNQGIAVQVVHPYADAPFPEVLIVGGDLEATLRLVFTEARHVS